MSTPLNRQQFDGRDQHIELIPVIGAHSYNQLQQKAKIQMELIVEAKDIGTWLKRSGEDRIQIWDGEEWFSVDFAIPVSLGLVPANMSERFNAEEIEWIREVVQEKEEEDERVRLRQLLAEQQSSGRE